MENPDLQKRLPPYKDDFTWDEILKQYRGAIKKLNCKETGIPSANNSLDAMIAANRMYGALINQKEKEGQVSQDHVIEYLTDLNKSIELLLEINTENKKILDIEKQKTIDDPIQKERLEYFSDTISNISGYIVLMRQKCEQVRKFVRYDEIYKSNES